MFKDILLAILIIIGIAIGVAVLIPALPVIAAIIYFAFVLIWSLITGESIWGEYGPFW